MCQNPVIAQASFMCDCSDRSVGAASHDWFIQHVWSWHNLFMNMTSLTCKFLQRYTDFWQVFFSPPLFTWIPTLRNAIDQEKSPLLLSFSAFFHFLSNSQFLSCMLLTSCPIRLSGILSMGFRGWCWYHPFALPTFEFFGCTPFPLSHEVNDNPQCS